MAVVSMDLLADFSSGLKLVASTLNFILIVAGVLLGTLMGMMPGIKTIHIVTLMLPIAYALKLPVETTMIFLVTIYYSCETVGGRIGRVLATQRDASRFELIQTGISSFVGGIIAVGGLIAIFFLLRFLRIQFGPAEYFALVIFALASLSFRVGYHPLKTLASTGIGLALATIGIDSTTGVLRFTPGVPELYDGIEFTTVALGLFIVSEVFMLFESNSRNSARGMEISRKKIDWNPLRGAGWKILWSTLIGFFIGALPGSGTTTARDVSDQLQQRSRDDNRAKETHTNLDLLLTREAAVNAAAVGTMVPLLALGVPGGGAGAILLGALLLYNITPGPGLFFQSSNIVWGVILASLISHCLLLIINIRFIRFFSWVNTIPAYILISCLPVLAFIGVYSLHASHFSILLMIIIGFFGYLLQSWRYPPVPLLLGFVLGNLLEDSLRRALAISGGDAAVLFAGPTTKVFWLLSLLVIVLPLARRLKKRRGS